MLLSDRIGCKIWGSTKIWLSRTGWEECRMIDYCHAWDINTFPFVDHFDLSRSSKISLIVDSLQVTASEISK